MAKIGYTAKLKTIAIIRLSSLGDIVHTLPAFQLLRKHFPEARITWIVEAPGAALLENFSGIDDIVVFNLKSRKGLFAKIFFLINFVNRRRRRFDLLIDFQGLIKSALLVISGDTLALHLADMTKTPAVGIFGPSSPQRNGPLFSQSRVIYQKQQCSFCYRRKCDTMTCLREIVIADIVAAARKIDGSNNRKTD